MYVRRAGGCVTRSTHCVADDASITSSNFGRVSIRAYNSKSNTNRFAVCKLPFARRPALRVGGPRKRGSAEDINTAPGTGYTSPDANESREPCNAAVRRDTHTEETTGTQLHGANRLDARPLCSGCLQSPVYDEYRARRSTRNAAVTAATAARACATLGEASKSKSGLM
jgi:hypothetical protein